MADMETLTEQERKLVDTWRIASPPVGQGLLAIIDRLTAPSSPAAPDAGEVASWARPVDDATTIGCMYHDLRNCFHEIIGKLLVEIGVKKEAHTLSLPEAKFLVEGVIRKLRTSAPTPAEVGSREDSLESVRVALGFDVVEKQSIRGVDVQISPDAHLNIGAAIYDLKRVKADAVCIKTLEQIEQQLFSASEIIRTSTAAQK